MCENALKFKLIYLSRLDKMGLTADFLLTMNLDEHISVAN